MGEPLDKTMTTPSRARASERLVHKLIQANKKTKGSEEQRAARSSTKPALPTGKASTETPSQS